MAFCANCGARLGDNDKFCASCGASKGPAQASTPPPSPPPPSGAAAPLEFQTTPIGAAETSSTGLQVNIAGLLCYLGVWITGIIFLILEKKSPSVKFMAAQSIVFFGSVTIVEGVLGGFFPHLWFISGFLNGIIGLLAFVMWIVFMVKAYQREVYRLPVAGGIADWLARQVK
jgi:uncharacterized membrane protein